MKPRILALVLAACTLAVPALADSPSTPYAGQQNRTIKALSEEDIAALLKGEGIGMAKAVELNGYPSPLHVLTPAWELELTPAQRQQIQAIFDRMNTAAKRLGAELVEHERVLDQAFAKSEITPDRLAAETAAAGELADRLRLVHLAAHVETRALLNPSQIALYQHRRGYGEPAAARHQPSTLAAGSPTQQRPPSAPARLHSQSIKLAEQER